MVTAKILTFAGSAREGSFNKRLARAAAAEAEAQGATVEFIDLADYELPIYRAEIEAGGLPDNAVKLKYLFKSHQGIFIASPEYNAGITPLLKNTLDWVSRKGTDEAGLEAYRGNVFALGSASPGGFGGMRGLLMVRQILSVGTGALVLPEQVAVARAGKAFDDDGGLADERATAMLKAQIARLIEVAAALYPGK